MLRQELIAASTLPERPPSPNNYARQRTMVVMETVRAATMATARRLERMAVERRERGTFVRICVVFYLCYVTRVMCYMWN